MSTLMSVASAMTWLLVRTSPFDEITMPVPAARPWPSVVLMFTMPGLTLAAIAFALSEPVLDEEPPELEPPDPKPLPLPLPTRCRG